MKRLNGWLRIGVLLSIAWMVGINLHIVADRSDTRAAIYKSTYDSCFMRTPGANCAAEAGQVFEWYNVFPTWDYAVIAAITPVLVAWILAYIAIWLVRWVAAGFRPQQ